ncbi:hypothetical protein HYS93_02890 [Candidatus Daviesbacteria bacterium]|nr:hypothetical protein [Candidatus Daviesbacteria bacterium]
MRNVQDIANAISHLKTHQKYPASKAELVAECQNLSDFSEEDKKWYEENLPDREYKSANEVIDTLGWKDQASKIQDIDEEMRMAA